MAFEASFKVGLDLGQLIDFTALVVLRTEPTERPGERLYQIGHLERWRGVEYSDIAAEVAYILQQPPVNGQYELVVDASGVGVSVTEQLKQAGLKFVAVTITSGADVHHNALGLTVPKADLINTLSVVQQQHRIKVAPGFEEGRQLAHEMQQFTRKQNPETGRNRFAVWREGEHDDTVLAAAVVIWHTERRSPWIAGVDAWMRHPPPLQIFGQVSNHPELTTPRVGTWQQWPPGAFENTIRLEND